MAQREDPEHRYARVHYDKGVDIVFMFSYRGGKWQLASKNWPKHEIIAKRSGETLRWSITVNGDKWADDFARLKDAARAASKQYYGAEQ